MNVWRNLGDDNDERAVYALMMIGMPFYLLLMAAGVLVGHPYVGIFIGLLCPGIGMAILCARQAERTASTKHEMRMDMLRYQYRQRAEDEEPTVLR
jgi:hypothetical protein